MLLDEKAEIQKQREAEAKARRAARKAGSALESIARPERSASTERTAPRLNLTGRPGTTWRDRQAAKEASAASVTTSPEAPLPAREEPQPLRTTGGYVPPALRASAGRDGSANGAGERYVPRFGRESVATKPPSRSPVPKSSSPAASGNLDEAKPASTG